MKMPLPHRLWTLDFFWSPFSFFYIFLKESFLFENGSFFVLCYIYNPKKFFLCISTIFEIF